MGGMEEQSEVTTVAMSKRHLMELKMMHKSLQIIATETQIAQERKNCNEQELRQLAAAKCSITSSSSCHDAYSLGCLPESEPVGEARSTTEFELSQKDAELKESKKEVEEMKKQQAGTIQMFDEEIREMQDRINQLEEQLGRERSERETLQQELANTQDQRSLEGQELYEKANNDELCKEMLQQIVDECVKQKLAMRTAQRVASSWLERIRSK